ncbi:unnamed protein product [Trichogramma brassicae]|uniref:Uncharacterized protein n=1 Tax=Trichogramma brassicae TaxID=86971 RepID=A0A6H5JBA4_9HYME|nr:unnamed protein product [Trichogramma brassicae]
MLSYTRKSLLCELPRWCRGASARRSSYYVFPIYIYIPASASRLRTRIQGEGRASRVPAAAAACPAQQCLADRVHLVFKDLPVFGYIINAVSTTDTNKCSKTRRGSSCNVRPGLSNSLKSSSRTAESHRVGKLFKFIRTPARQAIRALRRDAYNEYSCRSSHFYACARKQELNTLQYMADSPRKWMKPDLLICRLTVSVVNDKKVIEKFSGHYDFASKDFIAYGLIRLCTPFWRSLRTLFRDNVKKYMTPLSQLSGALKISERAPASPRARTYTLKTRASSHGVRSRERIARIAAAAILRPIFLSHTHTLEFRVLARLSEILRRASRGFTYGAHSSALQEQSLMLRVQQRSTEGPYYRTNACMLDRSLRNYCVDVKNIKQGDHFFLLAKSVQKSSTRAKRILSFDTHIYTHVPRRRSGRANTVKENLNFHTDLMQNQAARDELRREREKEPTPLRVYSCAMYACVCALYTASCIESWHAREDRVASSSNSCSARQCAVREVLY